MSDKAQFTTEMAVQGMTCTSCATRVDTALRKVPGVTSAVVSPVNHKALVQSTSPISPEILIAAVESSGYSAHIMHEEPSHMHHGESDAVLLKRFWIMLPFAAVVMLLGMAMMVPGFSHMGDPDVMNWLQLVLTLPVLWIGGRSFFVATWNAAKHRSATMDTLVAVGTGAAFIYSTVVTVLPNVLGSNGHAHVYFDTTVTIIALITLGKVLEERAKRKTSEAMSKLLGLQPDVARVRRNGMDIDVASDSLVVDDTLVIRPGERIATDARIVEGSTYVDESMLTGESLPVGKGVDDIITGGTVNQSGVVLARVVRTGSNTTLHKIVRMVEHAQLSRAPIQKLADTISSWFVPMVLVIGIITFVSWFVVSPSPDRLTIALVHFVSVLIIACPCALGLATPTAIMVGMGKGAEHGLLIRNAEALEVAHSVTTVVLDKTGTITSGVLSVTDIAVAEGMNRIDLLSQILSVEQYSEHPLAAAIVRYASEQGAATRGVTNVVVTSGRGIRASVNDVDVLIGSSEFLSEQSINPRKDFEDSIRIWREQAKTVLHVAVGATHVASIALSDTIRPSSANAVSKLKAMGLRVILLSGDNELTARAIAEQVGIDDVHAHVMPADKITAVRDLQLSGERVAMVGDGINDAPALAAADVGIAIGNGTDIAIEAADITLMHSDLMSVADALHLSRATMLNIKQNLFFAFIYNVLGIPLAAGVFAFAGLSLDPAVAAGAMALSSVSVVLNALRLRNFKVST